jgi:NADPH2 dehydrogenase
MSKLFTPLKVGNNLLQHRIVMAPLTRFRADDDHVPLEFVQEYYRQRASYPGTLIITEATFISPRASGYANVPGIYSKEQIAAWKKVTDAVHANGSLIWCQLWALGRTAKADVLARTGDRLVSSSAVPLTPGGTVPEALAEEEIWGFVGDYVAAAKNAIEAGFDGVEIHAANGYLLDQFTQDNVNRRTDAWGGSVEKRSRFALEVAKAVVETVGAERTGIRLSPYSPFQGMRMADPKPQFSHLVQGLKELKLAYLHVVEPRISGNADVEANDSVEFLVDLWGNTNPVLLAGGFTPDSAFKAVDGQYKDKNIAIVFGRHFISNPDLPFRIQKGLPLEPYNREKFYNGQVEDGYVDYAFSKEFEAARL